MPIYKYCCDECKYYTEKILAMSQCDVTQTCDHCDGDLKKMITMPAKTASLWGVDWRSGLGSNMYSKSLGAHVTSKREEEDRMRAKGFIPESDFGEGFIDNHRQKMADTEKEQAKINDTYTANLKEFNGDKIKAVEKTFPAHQMLNES